MATLAVLTANGCAPLQQAGEDLAQEKAEKRPASISEAEALKIADKIAAEKLAEYNRSTDVDARGGPFLFEDYDRDVRKAEGEPRPRLSVVYVYRKPRWKGHPNHFIVWVYLDTGETRFIGGR